MLQKLYSVLHYLVDLLVLVSLAGVTQFTMGFSHRCSGSNGMKNRRH